MKRATNFTNATELLHASLFNATLRIVENTDTFDITYYETYPRLEGILFSILHTYNIVTHGFTPESKLSIGDGEDRRIEEYFPGTRFDHRAAPLVNGLWKRSFAFESGRSPRGEAKSGTARVGFMNCPNNLLSVIFNGAQIESDLSTMPHCSKQAGPRLEQNARLDSRTRRT